MSEVPCIFLDTTALKFAADRRLVLRREVRTLKWDGFEQSIEFGVPDYEFPNGKLLDQNGKAQFRETIALPCIAALAKEGAVRLIATYDVWWEFYSLPKTSGQRFYGAPIELGHGPVIHQQMQRPDVRRIDLLYEFLSHLQDKRFQDLQRATGAFQGSGRELNRNQLLDAWHLRCAEFAGADYFLTLDKKLRDSAARNPRFAPKVQMIAPEALLLAIATKRPRLTWPVLRELMKVARRHYDGQTEAEIEFFGAPLNR